MNINKSRLQFEQWLHRFPADSIERLRTINLSAGSSRHIILCLTVGLYDGNIRKINRMITALLIARMKAERCGKVCLVARINDFMDDMHRAIDAITDSAITGQDRSLICGRPARLQVCPVRKSDVSV